MIINELNERTGGFGAMELLRLRCGTSGCARQSNELFQNGHWCIRGGEVLKIHSGDSLHFTFFVVVSFVPIVGRIEPLVRGIKGHVVVANLTVEKTIQVP